MKIKNKAFTLIELLVVIAIIGLLAGAVSVAFSQARSKSRDTRRKSDLKTLQTALEAYYGTYGHYPVVPSGVWQGEPLGGVSCFDSANWIGDLVSSGNISKLPSDPNPKKHTDGRYCYKYIYRGTAQEYKLLAYNTVESEKVSIDSVWQRFPAGCTNAAASTTYAIHGSNANTNTSKCW